MGHRPLQTKLKIIDIATSSSKRVVKKVVTEEEKKVVKKVTTKVEADSVKKPVKKAAAPKKATHTNVSASTNDVKKKY